MQGKTGRAILVLVLATAPISAAPIATFPHFPFTLEEKERFNDPTAMTFLPDTGARMNNCMLVAERAGTLKMWCEGSVKVEVSGVPNVSTATEGGLLDVVAHPDFETNRLVYLAWVETGPDHTRGAVVGRAKLVNDEPRSEGIHLEGLAVIWRQQLAPEDIEHFGTRIAIGPEGGLYISSGDRDDVRNAADIGSNLGKIIRLTAEGRPSGAFYPEGDVKASIWTLGHSNPAGLAFDASARLWEIEARDQKTDALHLIKAGNDYRPPAVIAGCKITARAATPCLPKWPLYGWPKIIWTPPIKPTSMIIYTGKQFPVWQGSALISGLTSHSLIRVKLAGKTAERAEAYKLDTGFRAVAQSFDGAVWLLEDKGNGRLYKLIPR
jgi:aldose sugar dehydrogenase